MGEKALLHEERKGAKLPYNYNEDPLPFNTVFRTFQASSNKNQFCSRRLHAQVVACFQGRTDNFKLKHTAKFKSIAPSNNETQGHSSDC